jgi:hypothetical protein
MKEIYVGWIQTLDLEMTGRVSYHCVTTVLPLCYHCATTVLPLCYHCATTVLPLCYHCVTTVLPLCYHCATTVLPLCYHCATTASHKIEDFILHETQRRRPRWRCIRPATNSAATSCPKRRPEPAPKPAGKLFPATAAASTFRRRRRSGPDRHRHRPGSTSLKTFSSVADAPVK